MRDFLIPLGLALVGLALGNWLFNTIERRNAKNPDRKRRQR